MRARPGHARQDRDRECGASRRRAVADVPLAGNRPRKSLLSPGWKRGRFCRKACSSSARVPRNVARSTIPLDSRGVSFGVGQRKRGAPRTADDHPALEAKIFADRFHVRDQVRQCVAFKPPFRAASPGAALIEQHGMKALRIEQPPMVRLAAAAGAAMQIDGGNAVGAADGFDIDFVPVAYRQKLRLSAARTDRSGCFWIFPHRHQAPCSPPVSSVPPAKLR